MNKFLLSDEKIYSGKFDSFQIIKKEFNNSFIIIISLFEFSEEDINIDINNNLLSINNKKEIHSTRNGELFIEESFIIPENVECENYFKQYIQNDIMIILKKKYDFKTHGVI